jgi:hypothetical protein
MARSYFMQTADGNVFSTNHPEYHKECKQLPHAEGLKLYREQERADLLKMVKPNTKVYTMLRSVSSSGMSRRISLFVIHKGELRCIDHMVATVMGNKVSDKGGIQVNGCGMDMGFHLVYNLGRYLWPKGTKRPHGTRNGAPDKDGGYALKHSWI